VSRASGAAGAAPAPEGGRTLPFLDRQPVAVLRGVGDRRAASLSELGITSVLDLLTHYPRRYLDRTRQAAVAELGVGEEALILARVQGVHQRRTRQRRPLVELDVDDGTGLLRVVFFNQAWRARQLPVGTQAVFFGKLDTYRGRRQVTNPVVDLVGDRTGRIIAVYPSSEKAGVSSWDLAQWVEEALERAGCFADPVPVEALGPLDLMARADAFRAIHRPDSLDEQRRGRRRLAFDELLRLQLEVGMRRRAVEREARAIRHVTAGPDGTSLVASFVADLPFELTGAQRRAVAEISADLAGPRPMHRLLQGDVGSGKTVVAAATLLVAVQGGHQGALMAPTEVLAEQHALGLRGLLGQLAVPDPATLTGERPLGVALLTSRTPAAERSRTLGALAAGDVDLVIGTHALLTEDVRFADLGVVVIDEQHRFGVEQRAALRAKGRQGGGSDPDLLVMTATPIPRTAAMVVYGDLDVTELDELPPGRAPVSTEWSRGPEDAAAWERVRAEVGEGHRAYVVCPLVDGSERVQARSATEEFERLGRDVLDGLRLGLLHGQMRPAEKEAVMGRFRRGEVEVLVATTVVEVGVDVPEATVMVVEDAERFGIAQLHQLRGRVGRCELPSWCYFLSASETPDAAARLSALEQSSDGFALAEVDLELRGEGAIMGTRQKGRSDLRLASLRRGDRPLVAEARQVAEAVLDEDPVLAGHPLLAEEIRLFVGADEADFLLKS
jgi:ATP-dependent DNA helicase RecG